MKSEFNKLCALVSRNVKLYFKDKLVFFVSLITPMMLVVLFLTFLGKIYEDSLTQIMQGVELSKKLISSFTGGWLFSSIMATSCITVAFCSNMMVVDKVNKVNLDFSIAPVKKSTVQVSYVIANFFTTIIICFATMFISFIYLAIVGWYLTFADVVLIIVNTMLLALMGTLLSSIIWLFVSNQGGLSAVCTLVSSMYGFLCGAYMPISQFANGIKYFVSLIPGTYATVLFRNFYMNGVLNQIAKQSNVSPEMVEVARAGFDGKIDFFGHAVPNWAMFVILVVTIVVLFGLYILLSNLKRKGRAAKIKAEKPKASLN